MALFLLHRQHDSYPKFKLFAFFRHQPSYQNLIGNSDDRVFCDVTSSVYQVIGLIQLTCTYSYNLLKLHVRNITRKSVSIVTFLALKWSQTRLNIQLFINYNNELCLKSESEV